MSEVGKKRSDWKGELVRWGEMMRGMIGGVVEGGNGACLVPTATISRVYVS